MKFLQMVNLVMGAATLMADTVLGDRSNIRGLNRVSAVGSVYVLGDSVSDAGKKSRADPPGSTGVVLDVLGLQSIPQQYPYKDGTWSDGGTWVSQSNEMLGKAKCYAYGSAMLTDDRSVQFVCDGSTGQICTYTAPGAFSQLNMFLGKDGPNFKVDQDVMVVQFGSNDIFVLGNAIGQLLAQGATPAQVEAKVGEFFNEFQTKFTNLIGAIKQALGTSTKIVVFNVPGQEVPAPLAGLLSAEQLQSFETFAALINQMYDALAPALGYRVFRFDQAIVTARNELQAANPNIIMDTGCAALNCYPFSCPSSYQSCKPETLKNHFWVDVLHPSSQVHEIVAREFDAVFQSLIA